MRRGRGQPPYQPNDKDRRFVRSLSGYGVRHDEIAEVVGISDVTMRKYYAKELRVGAIEANAQVAESLFNAATKHGNVAAQIFWLKTRAGWRDPLVEALNANAKAASNVVRFEWAPVPPASLPATIDGSAEEAA